VYIAHLPVLFLLQYRLLEYEASWPVKFGISLLGTLAISFLSYHVLVRGTFIGVMLNGRRQSR
jgi:peptidoglycan/LPS O-acetylase OafA/YrhL